ncbi:hypothetical protein SAY87_021969 [Trapa incisa]|uniref:Uncharacterized protein n=1 Tax=Trapa incisa TaxID=236973 RepID=A0AAN7JSE7_9MYRT|nr:hypothetical protein SAY87_021969 [Trapa incisa]
MYMKAYSAMAPSSLRSPLPPMMTPFSAVVPRPNIGLMRVLLVRRSLETIYEEDHHQDGEDDSCSSSQSSSSLAPAAALMPLKPSCALELAQPSYVHPLPLA